MVSLKTRVLHMMVQAGLEPAVRFYWSMQGKSTEHLKGSRRERFTKIYHNGHWNFGDLSAESRCGDGSTLEAARRLRDDLSELLKRLGAKYVLDIGCGDFNWMSKVELPCPYLGLDIVPDLTEANVAKYANEHRRFLLCDAVVEKLPSADVVLCREVLFHLSFRDAIRLLRNRGPAPAICSPRRIPRSSRTWTTRPGNGATSTWSSGPTDWGRPAISFRTARATIQV